MKTSKNFEEYLNGLPFWQKRNEMLSKIDEQIKKLKESKTGGDKRG